MIVVLFALTACAGCAVDRYRWNLSHAHVTPWTHLSTADHEAIVRLISDTDQEPIIGISAHEPDKEEGSTVSVYTGNVNQVIYKFWHGYNLKKESGTWRITFHGDCSHIIANLDLSGQMRRIRRERKKKRSNQAMERTAGRSAVSPSITSTFNPGPPATSPAVADLGSR